MAVWWLIIANNLLKHMNAHTYTAVAIKYKNVQLLVVNYIWIS